MPNESIAGLLEASPEVPQDNNILPSASENLAEVEPTIEQVLGEPIHEDGRFKTYEYVDSEGERKELIAWEVPDSPYRLPKGGFVIGGAARSAVQQMLGEEIIPPRDIDIVGIDEFGAKLEDFTNLEASVVDDRRHDEESAKVEGLVDYIDSRDFTINELLVSDRYAIATPAALRDLKEKVIRPTKYESETWEDYGTHNMGVSPKLVMKAIRLREEFQEMYGKGSIEEIDDWQFEAENVPLFYIALHLDRAIERGDKIAQRFYMGLLKAGTIQRDPSDDPYFEGVSASDPYQLARKISLSFVENSRDSDHWPFLFSRDDLNIGARSELDWYESPGEVKISPEYDKYANMGQDYIDQNNIKSSGFDGWDQSKAVRSISQSRPNIREDVFSDNYYLDEEEPLNAMESAFLKALQKEGVRP